ncbi:MAG: zinc ribbon domain-containing protein [Rikenellaceae bacterium]
MKEALIKLRSDIFSGIEIDIKDKKLQTRFKREHPGVDLAKAYSIVKSQLEPIELTGVLYSDIDNFHKAVSAINELLELPGLNLDAAPLSAYSSLLASFGGAKMSANDVKERCEYLDKRARIAVQKGKTEAAEYIGKFTSDCKKILTNNQYASFSVVFTPAFTPIILKIKTIKGSSLGIIQYRDLAESCFSLLKCNPDNIAGFQLVLALIALQCKDFKMELPSISSMTVCPKCGEKVSAGNICQKCNAYIKCPGCQKAIQAGSKQCIGCGVDIAKIEQYEKILGEAQYKLGIGKIDGVEESIKEFAANWDKYDKVIKVKELLSAVKGDLGNQEKAFAEAVRSLQLQKAQQIARKILESSKSASIESSLKDINAKIADADSIVKRANDSSSWVEKISLLRQVVAKCSDHAEAIKSLSRVELQSPSNLTVSVAGKSVKLSWNKFSADFVSYAVVRKVNSAPKSHNDGELLNTINSSSLDDVTTEAGVSYYYAVFSKVDSNYSNSGSSVGPVVTVTNIDTKSLTYDIKETYISFNFTLPKNAKEVEIYRDKKLIKTVSGSSYIDQNLTPDVEYNYTFVAVFEDITNKKSKATGVNISLTPTTPPKAIDLSVDTVNGKSTISWKTPPKGVLEIYLSNKPFSQNRNDIVYKESLTFDRVATSGNSCTVNKDFNGVRYYLPVVFLGSIGIAGEQVSITSILEPQDVTFDRVSERTFEVSWKWSNGVESVKIISQVDGGKLVENIINKSSQPTPKFSLTSPQGAKSIAISLQTRILDKSGKELLSTGVKKVFSLQVARVSFVEIKQGGFFSRSSFSLTIQSDTALPCSLELLIGEGRTPIDLNNYKTYLTINSDELQVGQRQTFNFKYKRSDKKKPLIFRLIPSDQSMFKLLTIMPETKQIK